MHYLCGAYHFSAENLRHRLMPQANAKNRQPSGIVTNNLKGNPGFIWRTGSRRYDNFLRFKGVNIRQRQRIVALNQHIRPQFTKVLVEVQVKES